ncbi:MAG: hypothetical protein R6V47_04640 [Candidatus Delongbacteria bacterium]
MRIAVDIMGGEKAPREILKGVSAFSNAHPEIKILLCVSENTNFISDILRDNKNMEGLFYSDRIEMEDLPYTAKKDKPDNTISGAIKAVENNDADCAFSCGNSGALILSASDILGLRSDHTVPALLSFIPMYRRIPLAVFDVGAMGNRNFNSDIYYAHLPETINIYSKLFDIPDPRIGLLNIGKESWKGTHEHKKIYDLLKCSEYNFTGNLEGDEILSSDTHILICDGFCGNIVLKLLESFNFMLGNMPDNIYNNIDCENEYNFLNFLLTEFSYETVGAAVILGINGKVALGHGKSSAKAVKSGLELCLRYCKI